MVEAQVLGRMIQKQNENCCQQRKQLLEASWLTAASFSNRYQLQSWLEIS